MDALVELARSSPLDTLAQAQSFHAKLTDALAKSAKKLAGGVDKVLGELILSPAHGHGLACAELLHYKLQCSVPPNDPGKNPLEFIDQARSVLLGISARDALVAAKAVSNISRQMTKALLHTDRCMRGLGALKAIVQKISGPCADLHQYTRDCIANRAQLHATSRHGTVSQDSLQLTQFE